MGSLIGFGAGVPLARLAHARFENELANGAAATTLAIASAVGDVVGLATCGD